MGTQVCVTQDDTIKADSPSRVLVGGSISEGVLHSLPKFSASAADSSTEDNAEIPRASAPATWFLREMVFMTTPSITEQKHGRGPPVCSPLDGNCRSGARSLIIRPLPSGEGGFYPTLFVAEGQILGWLHGKSRSKLKNHS